MNIVVIAHYQGDGSPTANFIHPQIVEYIRFGHKVRVVVPIPIMKKDYYGSRISQHVTETVIDGARHYFVRYLSASNAGEYGINIRCLEWSLFFAQKRVFDGFNPDIIHCHTIGLDSEAGFYIGKKTSASVVLTVHGTDVERVLKEPEWRIRCYCSHMDSIVAVSSVLRKKLFPYCAEEKISCILNGFNAKTQSGLPKEPLKIIQVGNLIPLKKVNVTIEAFARIHGIFNEAVLEVIGDGPERAALEKQCKDFGVSDCVVFRGKLPNQEVLDAMEKSEYFVMASSPEGFGVVYLEAMSMGCLTIGTKGEGISDLIVNGQNGYLVQVDDADEIASIIINLVNKPQERIRVAEKGMRDVQELTWKNNASKYLNLFRSLMQLETQC